VRAGAVAQWRSGAARVPPPACRRPHAAARRGHALNLFSRFLNPSNTPSGPEDAAALLRGMGPGTAASTASTLGAGAAAEVVSAAGPQLMADLLRLSREDLVAGVVSDLARALEPAALPAVHRPPTRRTLPRC